MRDLKDEDLTGLFLASDSASKKTQKNYTAIVAIDLLMMLLAAGISTYSYKTLMGKEVLYIVSAIFLLTSLILSVVLLTLKFEDIWYQGRALAESCKTLCWRFMARSELFEDSIAIDEAQRRFVKRIDELSREFSELNKVLEANLINKPVITPLMLSVRNLSLHDRRDYYISNRIENQKKWYSQKADFNKKRYELWFIIIIASQAISLISVTYLLLHLNSDWNLVGLFTTISAAALSWLQLKRHQELKQAYTTAAHELNLIVALAMQVTSESEFSKFVLDSENAVSREHTLWLAQRRR